MNGWLGEVQGLEVSLKAAKRKLASLDRSIERNSRTGPADLGMPIIRDPKMIAATPLHQSSRITSTVSPATPRKVMSGSWPTTAGNDVSVMRKLLPNVRAVPLTLPRTP